MLKTIISIFLCMLMIVTLIPSCVIAGDENDPEIIDNEEDYFGSFIDHPIRLKIFQMLGLLNTKIFDFIDIKSAWFYEKNDEPEYQFIALKLKDLQIINQRGIYSIHWSYNGERYAVGSHIYNNGLNSSCFVGLDRHFSFLSKFKPAEGQYDFENDIITFKFKKEYVGNPQPGDILTKTWSWTALRFNFEPFTILFSDGELVKDAAPFIIDYDDYGKDYVIKY